MERLAFFFFLSTFFLQMHCTAQNEPVQSHAMLFQAEKIARTYAAEIAKSPPPSTEPLTLSCLQTASSWLTVHLSSLTPPCDQESVFTYLTQWLPIIQELGIQAIHLKDLKKSKMGQTSLYLDPRWGTQQEFLNFAAAAEQKGISLISDLIGPVTGLSADFSLALQNFCDYPSLYCLIEIEAKDWPFLPAVGQKQLSANVPWLSLQQLHKEGYIPDHFASYNKQSDWNATGQIVGTDGTLRRWIYLKDANGSPLLNWITPSFC